MRLSQPTNTVALAPPLSRRYRFVEIHYRRPEETHKGRVVPARVETVVIFLPDVWSCSPTRLEWESMAAAYKKQLQDKLAADRTDLTHQAPSLLCAIYLSYYLYTYIYIHIYIHSYIYRYRHYYYYYFIFRCHVHHPVAAVRCRRLIVSVAPPARRLRFFSYS